MILVAGKPHFLQIAVCPSRIVANAKTPSLYFTAPHSCAPNRRRLQRGLQKSGVLRISAIGCDRVARLSAASGASVELPSPFYRMEHKLDLAVL